MHPPVSLPVVIVDRYPSEFIFDNTLLDDGVKDNTLSDDDIVPADRGGVPVLTADPTSTQALLDDIWPPHDPDFSPDPDPASTRL